jgi:hypothetical protein
VLWYRFFTFVCKVGASLLSTAFAHFGGKREKEGGRRREREGVGNPGCALTECVKIGAKMLTAVYRETSHRKWSSSYKNSPESEFSENRSFESFAATTKNFKFFLAILETKKKVTFHLVCVKYTA